MIKQLSFQILHVLLICVIFMHTAAAEEDQIGDGINKGYVEIDIEVLKKNPQLWTERSLIDHQAGELKSTDIDGAIKLYEKAAGMGEYHSIYGLLSIYSPEYKNDVNRYEYWINQLEKAKRDSSYYYFVLGSAYLDKGQVDKAIGNYKKAEERGLGMATFMLGLLSNQGIGPDDVPSRGKQYFKAAFNSADQGRLSARTLAACEIANNEIQEHEYKSAVGRLYSVIASRVGQNKLFLFQRRYEIESICAFDILGRLYEKGLGVEQDLSVASYLYSEGDRYAVTGEYKVDEHTFPTRKLIEYLLPYKSSLKDKKQKYINEYRDYEDMKNVPGYPN